MGLSLEQKQAMVSEVVAKLANAQAVIVAEYRGLDVEHVTQLRAKARKSGLYLRVLKNTLAARLWLGVLVVLLLTGSGAAEVLVEGDQWRVIREREKLEDLVRGERV